MVTERKPIASATKKALVMHTTSGDALTKCKKPNPPKGMRYHIDYYEIITRGYFLGVCNNPFLFIKLQFHVTGIHKVIHNFCGFRLPLHSCFLLTLWWTQLFVIPAR
jgi:hypothetical protein